MTTVNKKVPAISQQVIEIICATKYLTAFEKFISKDTLPIIPKAKLNEFKINKYFSSGINLLLSIFTFQ